MELPSLARLVGAALFLVLYVALWRRYRPSSHQHFAALIAGLAVGFYDWAGEVFLIGWDVWHYQGGDAFHIKGVPMEMVLGFIPCGMAICFSLLIPDHLKRNGSQSSLSRVSPLGWCVGVLAGSVILGPLIDSTYNPLTGSVVYEKSYWAVMGYVTPFWLGGAVVCLAAYLLVLRLLPGSPSAFISLAE